MRVSVIIPVYNEESTIKKVLDTLLEQVNGLFEVIIVDDGSLDSTGKICIDFRSKNEMIHYLGLLKNKGKTQAVKEGIKYSTGEIVIIQDADLEYDPSEINSVVDPIRIGVAVVVFGSRFLVRKASRALYFLALFS